MSDPIELQPGSADWQSWGESWRAAERPTAIEAIDTINWRRRVERERRKLVWLWITEICFTVGMVVGIGLIALLRRDATSLAAFVLVVAFCAVAWRFALINRRGLLAPVDASVAAQIERAALGARRRLEAVRFVVRMAAAELVAIAVVHAAVSPPRVWNWLAPSLAAFAVGVVVWARVARRRVGRELAEADAALAPLTGG